MSPTIYSRSLLKISVSQILQTVGFQSVQATALDILVEVLERYINLISKSCHDYAEFEPTLDDVACAFQRYKVNLTDLEEFIDFVDTPEFLLTKHNSSNKITNNVSKLGQLLPDNCPIKKTLPCHLGICNDPTNKEILDRQSDEENEYIYDYMPLMIRPKAQIEDIKQPDAPGPSESTSETNEPSAEQSNKEESTIVVKNGVKYTNNTWKPVYEPKHVLNYHGLKKTDNPTIPSAKLPPYFHKPRSKYKRHVYLSAVAFCNKSLPNVLIKEPVEEQQPVIKKIEEKLVEEVKIKQEEAEKPVVTNKSIVDQMLEAVMTKYSSTTTTGTSSTTVNVQPPQYQYKQPNIKLKIKDNKAQAPSDLSITLDDSDNKQPLDLSLNHSNQSIPKLKITNMTSSSPAPQQLPKFKPRSQPVPQPVPQPAPQPVQQPAPQPIPQPVSHRHNIENLIRQPEVDKEVDIMTLHEHKVDLTSSVKRPELNEPLIWKPVCNTVSNNPPKLAPFSTKTSVLDFSESQASVVDEPKKSDVIGTEAVKHKKKKKNKDKSKHKDRDKEKEKDKEKDKKHHHHHHKKRDKDESSKDSDGESVDGSSSSSKRKEDKRLRKLLKKEKRKLEKAAAQNDTTNNPSSQNDSDIIKEIPRPQTTQPSPSPNHQISIKIKKPVVTPGNGSNVNVNVNVNKSNTSSNNNKFNINNQEFHMKKTESRQSDPQQSQPRLPKLKLKLNPTDSTKSKINPEIDNNPIAPSTSHSTPISSSSQNQSLVKPLKLNLSNKSNPTKNNQSLSNNPHKPIKLDEEVELGEIVKPKSAPNTNLNQKPNKTNPPLNEPHVPKLIIKPVKNPSTPTSSNNNSQVKQKIPSSKPRPPTDEALAQAANASLLSNALPLLFPLLQAQNHQFNQSFDLSMLNNASQQQNEMNHNHNHSHNQKKRKTFDSREIDNNNGQSEPINRNNPSMQTHNRPKSKQMKKDHQRSSMNSSFNQANSNNSNEFLNNITTNNINTSNELLSIQQNDLNSSRDINFNEYESSSEYKWHQLRIKQEEDSLKEQLNALNLTRITPTPSPVSHPQPIIQPIKITKKPKKPDSDTIFTPTITNSSFSTPNQSMMKKQKTNLQHQQYSNIEPIDLSLTPIERLNSAQMKIVGTVVQVTDVVSTQNWICPSCNKSDESAPMIGCDSCDDWYHWHCIGIKEEPPENQNWYCHKCGTKPQKFKEKEDQSILVQVDDLDNNMPSDYLSSLKKKKKKP